MVVGGCCWWLLKFSGALEVAEFVVSAKVIVFELVEQLLNKITTSI